MIGLTTLENIGLKSILEDIPQLSIEIASTIDSGEESHDHADRYIISSDIFAKHTEYFLPRKNKTLIICDGQEIISGNIESVGKDADMIELYSVFERFVKDNRGEDCSTELSSREIEVLKELVNGLTIKEIADKLCISANTAVSHRKNISAKLGIRSISGLSVYAIMNGII
ncbi:MAG: helix-turn-helix transcriptional regulator [Muribaculaceae bacterium]|nr:helix-turn-helix transcriptional regulator [Muribaculaceae bacterium]